MGAVVLALVVFFLPIGSVAGLALWSRWLHRRLPAVRWAPIVGYALASASGLLIVYGFVLGCAAIIGASGPADPSEKARLLAEGISESMNCGALALPVAIMGALWLGFWTWRWRRGGRT